MKPFSLAGPALFLHQLQQAQHFGMLLCVFVSGLSNCGFLPGPSQAASQRRLFAQVSCVPP